jgi:hypothetical protein
MALILVGTDNSKQFNILILTNRGRFHSVPSFFGLCCEWSLASKSQHRARSSSEHFSRRGPCRPVHYAHDYAPRLVERTSLITSVTAP